MDIFFVDEKKRIFYDDFSEGDCPAPYSKCGTGPDQVDIYFINDSLIQAVRYDDDDDVHVSLLLAAPLSYLEWCGNDNDYYYDYDYDHNQLKTKESLTMIMIITMRITI